MTLTAITGVLLTTFCWTGEVCPVRLVPPDAPHPWLAAASTLERRLRVTPPVDRDCREVVVRTGEASGAFVEVITSDGRRGVRRLADARELEPTVAALIVTVASSAAETGPVVPPAAETAVAPILAAASSPWRALVTAGAGASLTFANTSAPVLELGAGALRGAWELALVGDWLPTFYGTGSTAKAGYTSSGELGASVARRQAVGARGDAALLFGARVGATGMWGATRTGGATTEERDSEGSHGAVDHTFTVAPVVAAFVGTSLPLFSFARLRSQLSMQWSPLAVSATDAAPSRWSVGLTIGVERFIP